MFSTLLKSAELEQSKELPAIASYQSILNHLKKAQLEADCLNSNLYRELLLDATKELTEFDESLNKWQSLLLLNLKFLNNYYKYLLQKAGSEKDLKALSELKYHLTELAAVWKEY